MILAVDDDLRNGVHLVMRDILQFRTLVIIIFRIVFVPDEFRVVTDVIVGICLRRGMHGGIQDVVVFRGLVNVIIDLGIGVLAGDAINILIGIRGGIHVVSLLILFQIGRSHYEMRGVVFLRY